MPHSHGKVWLVGAGPGDPGLLTCKGKQVLEQSEVVLYDQLVGAGILTQIPEHAEKIPVGKRAGHHTMPQEDIHQLLLEKAREGKRVVRLKGGDPFLFGRGGEELELLAKHNVPFEVVPGVSSALAVPAYCGIPVTHRGLSSSVHIITGHSQQGQPLSIDYPALVRLRGTLVFLMSVHAMPDILQGLLDAGMPPDTPAALLENGTLSSQRTCQSTLAHLAQDAQQAGIAPPALLVVGEVCSLAGRFNWVEQRPLWDVRVFLTRPANRASSLALRLQELGAEVVAFPSMETVPIPDSPAIAQFLQRLTNYDWMAFTSVTGVECVWNLLNVHRIDIRSLSRVRFAAIGSATKEALEQRGIRVNLLPARYDARALAEALVEVLSPGERIALPRAQEGSPALTQVLSKAGVPFDDIPVYRTNPRSPLPIPRRENDVAVFTSASTVRGFVQGMTDVAGLPALCIGEQTAQEARRHGMEAIVAKQATMEALVEALLTFHSTRKDGHCL